MCMNKKEKNIYINILNKKIIQAEITTYVLAVNWITFKYCKINRRNVLKFSQKPSKNRKWLGSFEKIYNFD